MTDLRARYGQYALVTGASSAVGFGPVPYAANYSAVKAYIASLGQALDYELRGSGVDVLTLAPGSTKTEGADNAPGIDFGKMPGQPMQAGPVVSATLRALGRRPVVIPGGANKVLDFAGKYLTPRRAQTALNGMITGRALDERPSRARGKRGTTVIPAGLNSSEPCDSA